VATCVGQGWRRAGPSNDRGWDGVSLSSLRPDRSFSSLSLNAAAEFAAYGRGEPGRVVRVGVMSWLQDPGLDDEGGRADAQGVVACEGELVALAAPPHHEVLAVVSGPVQDVAAQLVRPGTGPLPQRVLLRLADPAPLEGDGVGAPVAVVVFIG